MSGGAWYWYVDDDYQGNAVRIHMERKDRVLNCEWVCVKRERAPKYKRTAVGVNTCEHCGHEETVWETERVE